MKRGLIALLVIVLVLILIAVISIARPPTGYVVSHTNVHDEVMRIIASGPSAQVSERAGVSTSPTQESEEGVASRAQQEAALSAVTATQRAEVPVLQRFINRLFSQYKHLDTDDDGLVSVTDFMNAVETRNDEQARLIIDNMYRGRGEYKAYVFEPERDEICEREVARGDANNDGGVDVSDTFYITDFLFGVGEQPVCPSAHDIDFDGQLTYEDGILIMRAMLLDEYSIPRLETAS